MTSSIRLTVPGKDDKSNDEATQDDVDLARRMSRAFRFPYETAYSIQLDLMQSVFQAIEDGDVGVFESPTGTGKSLSLLCAACAWLERNAARHSQSGKYANSDNPLSNAAHPDDEPEWVRMHATARKQDEAEKLEIELQDRIRRARDRLQHHKRENIQRAAEKRARTERQQQHGHREETVGADSDEEFFIDYDANTSSHAAASVNPNDPTTFLSPAVQALMEQTGAYMPRKAENKGKKPFFARQKGSQSNLDDDEDDEPETMPKIIFASRTHSQLTQFVGELKRTAYAGGKRQAHADGEGEVLNVRMISIGSRKQMCINSSVIATGERNGVEAMNERCIELMKAKQGRCRFLPSHDEAGHEKMLEYRDSVFSDVHDIEDAVQLGREMHTCPYFGARQSAKQAHLVTLPYNLLLNAAARNSLNINLEGSIVIIDEAHNLIDTILASHTLSVSSTQIERAIHQIQTYADRFSTRLKGSNEVNVKKFLRILDGLQRFCATHQEDTRHHKDVANDAMTTGDLMQRIGANVDQVNLLELSQWMRDTKITRKVAGYADKQLLKQEQEAQASKKQAKSNAVAALHAIEALLLSLTNPNLDGRIFANVEREQGDGSGPLKTVRLKYQLLNPSEVFREVVQQARSVILAGGTMEPVSDVQTQLLPYLDPSKFVRFSCSHIIPAQNMMAAILCKGAKGHAMEFKFDARSNSALLDELAMTLINFANIVPHGMVVFVPSYGFLDAMLEQWKRAGSLTRMAAKKRVFCEPKNATEVDRVLQGYARAIDGMGIKAKGAGTGAGAAGGAILFAVVGAKLSEGINFSDRLARAVIMVGMPFANAKSVELSERMQYVRRLAAVNTKNSDVVDAGQELYVNLCMKAVNQSIGRAIRHRNDYAALIFLDARYARKDIRDRLPQWIRQSTNVYDTFGPSMAALGTFFRNKKRAE